ncbi:hypothetical protein X801_06504, partial [Opisthorchis viverrini]
MAQMQTNADKKRATYVFDRSTQGRTLSTSSSLKTPNQVDLKEVTSKVQSTTPPPCEMSLHLLNWILEPENSNEVLVAKSTDEPSQECTEALVNGESQKNELKMIYITYNLLLEHIKTLATLPGIEAERIGGNPVVTTAPPSQILNTIPASWQLIMQLNTCLRKQISLCMRHARKLRQKFLEFWKTYEHLALESQKIIPLQTMMENRPTRAKPLCSLSWENVISRVPKTLKSPKKELSAFLAFVEKVFNVMESDPSVEWRQVLKQIRLIRLCLSPASIAGRDGVQAKKKFDHKSEFMNIRKFFEEQSGLIVQTVLEDDETGPFSQADIELMFREVVYSAPRDIIWEYLSRCKIVPKTKEMKQLLFASAGIRVDKQSGSFNQISSTADTHGMNDRMKKIQDGDLSSCFYPADSVKGQGVLASEAKKTTGGQQQQHWVGCLDSESAYHIHHPKHELSSSVSSVTTLVNELSQQNGPDDLKYKPSVHVTTSIRDIINERQTNGASINRSISTKSLQPAESTSFSWPVGEIFVPSRKVASHSGLTTTNDSVCDSGYVIICNPFVRKHAQSHPDEVIKVVDFSMHAHSEPCSAPENQDYRYVTKENGTKYHVVDRNSGKPLKYTEAIATNMRCAQKHTTKSD